MSEPITFTQFLLPDGRQQPTTIEVPDEVAAKAREIIAAGFALEIEVLQTGEVSATIADHEIGQDADIVLHANGPGLPEAIAGMLMRFDIAAALTARTEGEA